MLKEKEIFLSDVIDYNRDIKPYPIVQIYSGVGSGKNTYIEKLIKGEIDNAPKGLKVLLITSRRAKVDETLSYYDGESSLEIFCKKIGVNGNILVRRWYKEEREAFKDNLYIIPDQKGAKHHIYQDSVVCTNAFIAAYFRYCYNANNVNTYLWEKFDLIVVDEAHSLFMDATYQEAPFYINDMIQHYIKMCSETDSNKRYPNCKHLILMTGTPVLLKEYFKKVCVSNIKMNILDVREECKCVVPKKIYFIESRYVKKIISDRINDGKRIIYFSNSTQTPAQFCFKSNIPKDKIVVSFSKKERRDELEKDDPGAFNDMIIAEKSIRKDFKIPEQFNLFVTTTRYKEGINIKDDIDYMFIETHNSSDAIQMAGRVRKGVDVLYIVIDAKPNIIVNKNDEIDRAFEKGLCAEYFNISEGEGEYYSEYKNFMEALVIINFERYAIKLIEEESEETSQYEIYKKYETQFNDHVEEKFGYIRYSYIDDKFKYYDLKQLGIDYDIEQEKEWQKAISENSLVPLVSSWFHGSEVLSTNEMYHAAWHYWNKNKIQLNISYSLEEFNTFIEYWADLYEENPRHPNAVLKRFSHYQYERCGDGKKKRKFIEMKN